MDLDLVLNLLDLSKFLLVFVNIYILFYIVYFKKVEKQEAGEIKNFLKEINNVGIIIAHPDDESMFFIPTITSLSNFTNLHLLCLSSGNFDGIGETRKKEFEKSSKFLNFKTSKVIEDLNLQDGMKNEWKKENILNHIQKFQKENEIEMVTKPNQNFLGPARKIHPSTGSHPLPCLEKPNGCRLGFSRSLVKQRGSVRPRKGA